MISTVITFKDKTMSNKRKSKRFESLNLVSYKLFNENNELCAQGIGRTLNISSGGILLDIEDRIDAEIKIAHMEIALDENLIIITGSTVYSRKTENGYTECGIKFNKTDSESQKMLETYICKFFNKNIGLLRSDATEIESVALTLAKEHRIISDYILTSREIISRFKPEYTTQTLVTLFDHMENDLSCHFNFEEKVLFEAAVYGAAQNEPISETVNSLKSDHAWFISELKTILDSLKRMVKKQEILDNETRNTINDYMEKLKSHTKTEMKNVFAAIDSDQDKLNIVNRLLHD